MCVDYCILIFDFCSWWQHAEDLACYEQQDAHEFFISMLDGIHEKVEKDRRRPHSQGNTIHGAKTMSIVILFN